jgi:hypothetical protein
MSSFAFYLVLMSSSLNVDAYITVREDTKHTQLAVHQDSSSSKAERGKSTEERNKYGGILDAGAGKAWALGTFVTLLMAGCSAFRVGDMATFLQSLGDISAESAHMKNVRLWLAQCMINNGLNHIAIIVWLLLLGKGDLSWFGPYSDASKKVTNWGAAPLVFVFIGYGYWIFSMDAVSRANWPRFVFPPANFILGIPALWIQFFKVDMHEWPAEYAGLWIALAYYESAAAVLGLVYVYQLFTHEEGGKAKEGATNVRRN